MENNSYRVASHDARRRLVEGLGWFSIGLGLAEILAPRALSQLIGVRPKTGLMRLMGMREVATGIGILARPHCPHGLEARVAGDTMDLLFLGSAFGDEKSNPLRLAVATTAVAGITALDVLCMQDLKEGPGTQPESLAASRGTKELRRGLIINRPPEELYPTWREFSNLPNFMSHLISVMSTGENTWHWIAKGPMGTRVEWDARITEDIPNKSISWKSLENADVDSEGTVTFEPAPAGRGTIVRVQMHYRPPAGKMGARIAKLLGQSPEKQIAVDLLRFKQMMETGEIARTEGQPAGRASSTSKRYDELLRA